MKGIALLCAAGAASMLTLAGPASAQANRTFVSGHGEDTNACTLTAPCRSFAHALTQTNPGGEITVLDPAGYGTVTINKAVSIINDGVGEAGVTVTTATDAIFVSVGASDVVNLRGLTLTGGGVGTNGIRSSGLGALNIQNCAIRGFVQTGIGFSPGGTAALNVSDTIVSDIIPGTGVAIDPIGGGAVTAAFNRVQAIDASFDGFSIDGNNSTAAITVTIANSAATNNSDGIHGISANGAAQTQVMVSNSVASNNSNTGVLEDGPNSTVYLAKNTIAGNGTAFSVSNGGALFSFGDNDIKTNGDDGTSPAIPLVSTK